MEEDFVPFEIAKKLKEKGFREPCFGWYHPSGVCIYGSLTLINPNKSDCRGCDYDDLLISHNDDKHIDAPTITQVLKWLREEKRIHVGSDLFVEGYTWIVNSIETKREIDHESGYEAEEQALLTGIEYVIDNLI